MSVNSNLISDKVTALRRLQRLLQALEEGLDGVLRDLLEDVRLKPIANGAEISQKVAYCRTA